MLSQALSRKPPGNAAAAVAGSREISSVAVPDLRSVRRTLFASHAEQPGNGLSQQFIAIEDVTHARYA
jgi:hypothetical protein